MTERNIENCVEWLTGDDYAVVSLTQRKFISRVKKIAQKHPETARILAQNKDGSICARIPLSAVHLTIYDRKTASLEGVEEEDDE